MGRWTRGRERGAEVQPSIGSGDLGQAEEDARERKPGAEKMVETEGGGRAKVLEHQLQHQFFRIVFFK